VLSHPQRRVAFLPLGPIALKSLRPAPYREDPKTLGDHLRRKRNESGLYQQQIASRMALSEWTYANWENGRTTPGAVLYRGIVKFLGYYPHPTPRTHGDRLRKIRRCRGLTSRHAAHLADVDHQTFLMWERGKWTPTVLTRARLDNFLEEFERKLPETAHPLAAKKPQATLSGLLRLAADPPLTAAKPPPAPRATPFALEEYAGEVTLVDKAAGLRDLRQRHVRLVQ
jgi:transcriptional regulator with XRE-family HTH domain